MKEKSNWLDRLAALVGQGGIGAGVLIGSRARAERPADEYSDLDVILLVDDIEPFLHTDGWLAGLGEVGLSFVEDTVAGGKERRILFADGQDVDFLFLRADALAALAHDRGFREVAATHRVLFDKVGVDAVLPAMESGVAPAAAPSAEEFTNAVHNFWFHTVWAMKKVRRGEWWVAKQCVDGYLKGLLLTMLEWHAHALHGLGYRTWHSGRFLEQWAEPWVVEALPSTFGAYGAEGICAALEGTMALYHRAAAECAGCLGYAYPAGAEDFARACLQGLAGEHRASGAE